MRRAARGCPARTARPASHGQTTTPTRPRVAARRARPRPYPRDRRPGDLRDSPVVFRRRFGDHRDRRRPAGRRPPPAPRPPRPPRARRRAPTPGPPPRAPTAAHRHLHPRPHPVLGRERAHRVQRLGHGRARIAERERRVRPPREPACRPQPPRAERPVDARRPGVGAQVLQPCHGRPRRPSRHRRRYRAEAHRAAVHPHRPPPGVHEHRAAARIGQLADRVGQGPPAIRCRRATRRPRRSSGTSTPVILPRAVLDGGLASSVTAAPTARATILRVILSGPEKPRGGPSVTYVIAEPCVDVLDKACIEECPVDCIYEGDRMLYIHPDECVDCGACEPVCPVEAIYYEDDVPEQWTEYTKANVEFFDELGSPGGASKVGKIDEDPPSSRPSRRRRRGLTTSRARAGKLLRLPTSPGTRSRRRQGARRGAPGRHRRPVGRHAGRPGPGGRAGRAAPAAADAPGLPATRGTASCAAAVAGSRAPVRGDESTRATSCRRSAPRSSWPGCRRCSGSRGRPRR